MARKVKCHITKEEGTSDDFVKIGRYYYKSQQVYDAYQKKIQARKDLIDYICNEFFGYGDGEPFPTFIPRRLKDLEGYEYDLILETFKKYSNTIHHVLRCINFESQYAAFAYIIAIIKNNIDIVSKELDSIKFQEKKNTNIEFENLNKVDNEKRITKDLSQFLDEEDF